MKMDEHDEEDYQCPDCGAFFKEGARECPGCGTGLDWDEPDDQPETDIDKIIKEVTEGLESSEEAAPAGPGDVEDAPSEDAADGKEPDGVATDGPEEGTPEDDEEEPEQSEEELEEEPEEPLDESEEPEEEPEEPGEPTEPAVPVVKGTKLYAGKFSILGLVFLSFAILAIMSLVILYNWDTWINGADVESIGDNQKMMINLAIVGTVVCLIISAFDVLRSGRAARS